MPDTPKTIRASTQDHLDIHTIKDHLVILKDGAVALVLQVSAINFGLLSENEQDATIFAYASLLNSLSFSTQILIRSTRKDISAYIERLDAQLETTRSQKLKEQIIKYRAYIKSLVKENKVMEKRIYVVIPFTQVELGLTPKSFNPFAKAPQKPSYDDAYILQKAKITLYPRRDHLIRQFARLGLQSRQLTTQELLTLFFQIYNPATQAPPFLATPEEYETPLVQTQDFRAAITAQLKPSTPPPPTAAPVSPIPPPPPLPPTPTPTPSPVSIPPTPVIPPISPAPTPVPTSTS